MKAILQWKRINYMLGIFFLLNASHGFTMVLKQISGVWRMPLCDGTAQFASVLDV